MYIYIAQGGQGGEHRARLLAMLPTLPYYTYCTAYYGGEHRARLHPLYHATPPYHASTPHQVIIVPGYGLAVAGGQYAVADIAAKLQPYAEAATFCTRGCNPRCQRLQPYAPEAAALGARGCNPMHQRLQPSVPEAATLCLRYAVADITKTLKEAGVCHRGLEP